MYTIKVYKKNKILNFIIFKLKILLNKSSYKNENINEIYI